MIQVCTECGSSDVYTDQWVSLNDDSVMDGAGELYCGNCSSECKTEWKVKDEEE